MKQSVFTIIDNTPLTANVYRMRLKGDTGDVTVPGQFVNVKPDGMYLRRPISVCDREDGRLTLIYKTVGEGTERMSRMAPGQSLDLLTGLGNGYDMDICGDRPLLVGGGVGVPPLYWLAKELIARGRRVSAVLGFNTGDEVFYEEEFAALGCGVTVATVDGSHGRKGFVTDALPEGCTCVYACGPLPMLRAVYGAVPCPGQFSFEERMGCGFGACMGCSVKTVNGFKHLCKDGPVLRKEEILWND